MSGDFMNPHVPTHATNTESLRSLFFSIHIYTHMYAQSHLHMYFKHMSVSFVFTISFTKFYNPYKITNGIIYTINVIINTLKDM